MYLHDKLVAVISNSEDSVFNPQTDEENEI